MFRQELLDVHRISDWRLKFQKVTQDIFTIVDERQTPPMLAHRPTRPEWVFSKATLQQRQLHLRPNDLFVCFVIKCLLLFYIDYFCRELNN